jgi:hypothetical protein
VPDATTPSGIGGVLATVHEISEKVVAERRVSMLRDLGTEAAENSAEETCCVAAQTLAWHSKDVPFALLYLIDPDGQHARLAGATGLSLGKAQVRRSCRLTRPTLIRVGRSRRRSADKAWWK